MRGSIIKRGKTYTIIYYYEDPITGEKRQKWEGKFQRKKDAEEALTKALHEVDSGTYIPPHKSTIEEYLLNWLDVYVKPRLKATTYGGYSTNIRKHIIPYIGHIRLDKLKVRDIEVLYNRLIKQGRADGKGGLSAKSVIYVHRVLRKALEQAVKEQLIPRNVASLVTPPLAKKYHPRVYGVEEVKKLLKAVQGSTFEVPIALAALSGLRRGEALGLRWTDIDWKNGTITISQQLVQTYRGNKFDHPKTEGSNRTIPIPGTLMELLLKKRKRQSHYQELLGDAYQNHNLVSCHDDGSLIRPGGFSKIFSRLLKAHGLEHVRFHDLRHANATMMLKANVPPKVASKMLGHSTISITLDLYSHVLDDMGKEAASAIDNMVFGDDKRRKSKV